MYIGYNMQELLVIQFRDIFIKSNQTGITFIF